MPFLVLCSSQQENQLFISFFDDDGFHSPGINLSIQFISGDISFGHTPPNDQTDVPFNSDGILARASLFILLCANDDNKVLH